MKQIGNIINTFQHGFSVKIAKNFGSLWFTFEPKFRPKPKLPILPEPKQEFRFTVSVHVKISAGTGTEPNFGRSLVYSTLASYFPCKNQTWSS